MLPWVHLYSRKMSHSAHVVWPGTWTSQMFQMFCIYLQDIMCNQITTNKHITDTSMKLQTELTWGMGPCLRAHFANIPP